MAESFGRIVAARRANMEMSLNVLSQRMGGSPSASFLNRVETGKVTPTRGLALRLADALSLPREQALNASGHATENQERGALDELRRLLGEHAPVVVHVPVYDRRDSSRPTGERRQRVLRTRYDARIVDLAGARNEPFAGEVIYDPDSESKPGAGVVVDVDGELTAWTVQEDGSLVNGLGAVLEGEHQVHGVIKRVSRVTDL